MTRMKSRMLCGLLASLVAGVALAGQPPVRSIERIYVSPGASGSIDNSSSMQRYDGYGGVQVPRSYEQGSSRVIIDNTGGGTNGGIRQSIEYPNGVQFDVTPGTTRSNGQRQSYP